MTPYEYPVDLERARAAFGRAVRELERVLEEWGPYFCKESERRREIDPNDLEIDNDHGFIADLMEYRPLLELAENVEALTLTREEIRLMLRAETEDWAKRAADLASFMALHPAAPPPEPSRPWYAIHKWS